MTSGAVLMHSLTILQDLQKLPNVEVCESNTFFFIDEKAHLAKLNVRVSFRFMVLMSPVVARDKFDDEFPSHQSYLKRVLQEDFRPRRE